MKNINGIVRLDVVDTEPDTPSERILWTFYLVRPKPKDLRELQRLMNNRFEEDECIETFEEIFEYINSRFKTINIETKEVEW